MASETLLIFVLMLSSVRVGKSAEALFNLTCEPAEGVIRQTTNISCSIESQTGPVIIDTVFLTRFRENKPCFTFQPYENRETGDSRFKVESLPSLQLHNTSISDEGGYRYYIRTNQGDVNAEFTIRVTECFFAPKHRVDFTLLIIATVAIAILALLIWLLVVVMVKLRVTEKLKKALSYCTGNFAAEPDDVEEKKVTDGTFTHTCTLQF